MERQTSEAIGVDHRRIGDLLNELEAGLEAPPAPDVDAWATRVRGTLGVLRTKLTDHFASEEGSGLFGELARHFPRFGETLARLKDEHRSILAAFDGLARLVDGDVDGSEVAAVRAQAREAIEVLRKHESDESDVISEAYGEDIGGPD